GWGGNRKSSKVRPTKMGSTSFTQSLWHSRGLRLRVGSRPVPFGEQNPPVPVLAPRLPVAGEHVPPSAPRKMRVQPLVPGRTCFRRGLGGQQQPPARPGSAPGPGGDPCPPPPPARHGDPEPGL